MRIMGIFTRADDDATGTDEPEANDLLIATDFPSVSMDKQKAMAIPAFSACVNTITGTVAALPVKLYRRIGDRIEEVEDDPRVRMLNGDTGDTLTGPEMKAALVEDYLCDDKGGSIFINRGEFSNEVKSLHYVRAEDMCPLEDKIHDPIFKHVRYLVAGREYEPWQFVRILRSTRNGRFGRSVITANNDALSVAYMTMLYERSLVQRGGNKRGFLRSTKKLGKKALEALKSAWRRFYGSTDEGVIVLNDGLEFTEATATSTEMQLNENKQTNANDIYSMFSMPPDIIRSGGTDNASKNARDNYVRFCIMRILADLKASLDRSLLLEDEKATYFFDVDLSELTKADMKERWEAWKIAKEGGFIMPDEVRRRENMPPLGLDYISLGLNDVLLDAEKNHIIVPNMGKAIDLNALPVGGEQEEPAKQSGNEQEPAEGGEQDASNVEE